MSGRANIRVTAVFPVAGREFVRGRPAAAEVEQEPLASSAGGFAHRVQIN